MCKPISYRFYQAIKDLNPDLALKHLCENIIEDYNRDTRRTFNLQPLDFIEAEYDDQTVIIAVKPRSGMVRVDDLQLLKYILQAHDLEVHAHPQFAICLIYNRH